MRRAEISSLPIKESYNLKLVECLQQVGEGDVVVKILHYNNSISCRHPGEPTTQPGSSLLQQVLGLEPCGS